MWFKRRLGNGPEDNFGIASGQRFRAVGSTTVLWEVEAVTRHTWEPVLHVRLHRVDVPGDRKTVALETLRDHRFFHPAN